jgi:hypothetical protein
MTLEELKAAWDAALAKAKAAPEDAGLKAAADAAEKAYNDAKAAEDAKSKGGSEDEDESKWDEKTKAYIKKLRDENASHRTKNKELSSSVKSERERVKAILKAAGIEEESEKPEEQVKTLTAASNQLAFRNAVLETAVKHGISGDDVEYYEFLVTKAVGELEDGEELSEEKLTELVSKVKKTGGKGAANTSVDGGKGGGGTGGQPPPGGSGAVSLDQFVRMSITEKSELYTKNPDVYTQIDDRSTKQRKLV